MIPWTFAAHRNIISTKNFRGKNRREKMFDMNSMEWTRKPSQFVMTNDMIQIVTEPHTDLWQRTYYHFRNDSAPLLQAKTVQKFFSFVVKTEFESSHRFDQCGIVVYLDCENWIKASVEYENQSFQRLGSVVTNRGFSDWATTSIDASIKNMWYRLSRREDDFCIECSLNGNDFSQIRICHLWNAENEIRFGIYACSPENSSFTATFKNLDLTGCRWKAHDGQKPD